MSLRDLEPVAITWLERGFDGIRISEPSGSVVDFATLIQPLSTACGERDAVLILNTSSPPPPDSPVNSTSCMIARPDFGPMVLLAMRREEASPITDAIRSVHDPTYLQHMLYLRDGRELSLDAFPVEEAEYMVQEYAKDPIARLTGGIRRRLAPLLDNGRNELELAYVLLFTLPGSPLLYYGDEIGMGDNLDLEDHDALRTPFSGPASQPADSLAAMKPTCFARSSPTPSSALRPSTSKASCEPPSRCSGGYTALSRFDESTPCLVLGRWT